MGAGSKDGQGMGRSQAVRTVRAWGGLRLENISWGEPWWERGRGINGDQERGKCNISHCCGVRVDIEG